MRSRVCGILVLATCLILISVGCGKGPTDPDPPPPPIVKEKILTTVQARYLFSEGTASGTVTYEGLGNTITKNLGEQAELGEITKDTTSPFTITINVNGALKRVFKDVPLSGTKKFTTTVLELQDFYWEYFVASDIDTGYVALVPEGGENTRWGPETMTVYINPPQHPTLIRDFTEGYKAAIRNTIYRYQAASRGWIKSVTILDGDKRDRDGGHPPVGEVWIFPSPPSDSTTGTFPMINSPWPLYYGHVDSTITWLCEPQIHELDDALIKTNQNSYPPVPNDVWDWNTNSCKGRDVLYEKWIPFLFSRPVSDRYNGDPCGYRIYHDREEENGFTDGVSGTVEVGVSVHAEDDTYAISGPGRNLKSPEAQKNGKQMGVTKPGERERIRN